ncbi:hypothetical protein GALL_378370 [mine drainage metagenome]|uniref:PAS domain-containing protein n=1 Tax=mine drainage metagenome TaxID=410659 RepID=A0A1J5QSE7_9ZZZZ
MGQLPQTQPSSSTKPLDMSNPAFSEEGMIVLMLNENGMILNCNSVAVRRFGCTTSQLLWQPISKFLPKLSGTVLMQNGKFNPRLRFLSRIGHLFDVMSTGGEIFQSRVFFNEVENYGRQNLCLVICPEAQAGQPSKTIYYPS